MSFMDTLISLRLPMLAIPWAVAVFDFGWFDDSPTSAQTVAQSKDRPSLAKNRRTSPYAKPVRWLRVALTRPPCRAAV